MFAVGLYFRDRILRDDAAIVFDLDLKLIVRQDALTELKDLREAIRFQPVLRILADVGLKENLLALPHYAAAIDEVLHDVAHFGDMGVGRDLVAVRQNKTRESARMLFENGTKII